MTEIGYSIRKDITMISVIKHVWRSYNSLIMDDTYADPRSKDYFLISRPGTALMIVSFYLYFCTKLGPRLMEGRKPFELKKTLIVYNAVQVLISGYIVWLGYDISKGYSLFCEGLDYSTSTLAMRALAGCWLYYVTKLSEFLETVFFVLRKKNRQITFLHLYHHTLMFVGTWIGMRYFPVGHGTYFGVINSFVHVIMYLYYFLASLGPQYQKYLWWKKHLTALQLVQFAIVFIHNFYPLFTDCTYPKSLHMLVLVFAGFFVYLFGKFYIKTYLKSKANGVNKNH